MGLFSFLKNAGAKVLTKKNAATVSDAETERLETELMNRQKVILLNGVVDSLGIKTKDFDLEYSDETVTAYGSVKTQADKEKIILALGNVSGVAAVDDRMVVTGKTKKAKIEAHMHEVQKGESLSKIAKKYYGDASKYTVIFEANQPLLKDPNKIYPGQMLRIPQNA